MNDQSTPTPTLSEVGVFFLLTLGISWLVWLPAVPAVAALLPSFIPRGALTFLGPFGPSLAAFILVMRRGGRPALTQFIKSRWAGSFRPRWLVPILLFGPVTAGLSVLVLTMMGITPGWEYALPPFLALPIFLALFVGNGLAEEFGWRGYALPLLRTRWGMVTSGIVIGVVWGLWHLPLVLIPGTTQASIPFGQYLLQTVVFSVLYAWIAEGTGFSVFAAALFHGVNNVSAALLPFWTSDTGRWVQFTLLSIATLVIVTIHHRGRESQS